MRSLFIKSKHCTDLNDLLKEEANDYQMIDGKYLEKNPVNYHLSLHTRKLQKSRYVKFDDNLLSLKSLKDDVSNLRSTKLRKTKSNARGDQFENCAKIEEKPLTEK